MRRADRAAPMGRPLARCIARAAMLATVIVITPWLLLAAGCPAEEIPPSPLVDADNDGYPETVDCDEANPLVHPDAAESCDGLDEDCDHEVDEDAADAPTWFVDDDDDGYGDPENTVKACTVPDGAVDNARDCNDVSAIANPDVNEVCDGIDNDCDGIEDEGTAVDATIWYEDFDGDGYGTSWSTQAACDQPSGFVAEAGDCHDGDETVHPDADEVCDGEGGDEDCDGLYDDDDPDATGGTTWYADDDGDGYGDPDDSELACNEPEDHSELDTDCDDGDDTVNPDAAELCGDGVDNDCDGTVDEEDAPFAVQWYVDDDGDGYGDALAAGPIACTQPSGHADNPDDCDDTDPLVHPGATETWYDGVDQDCAGDDDDDADGDGYLADTVPFGTDCDDTVATTHPDAPEICDDSTDNDCDGYRDSCDIDLRLEGEAADDNLGSALAGLADWDGDGDRDLVVGADRQAGGGAARGAVYVVNANIAGSQDVASVSHAIFWGDDDQDRAGTALAAIGDAAILVGAFGADLGGAEAGAAYLLTSDLGEEGVVSDGVILAGEVAGDNAGAAVATAGDVDGDGEADLLVGAWGQDAGGADAGAAYLVLGPVTADADLSYADTRFVGSGPGEYAGSALVGGDLDGDGFAEVIVGAPYLTGDAVTGGAYVVRGPVDTSHLALVDADARLLGEGGGDLAGWAVAIAGDLDGDGDDELLVAAPDEDAGGTTAGAVYVVQGSVSGDEDLGLATAKVLGDSTDTYLGSAVAGLGDIDEDGLDDVILGARLDDHTGTDGGAAYVLLGPLSGMVSASTAIGKGVSDGTGDWAGASVARVGDLGGGIVAAMGAPLADSSDADAGAVLTIEGW